MQVNIPAPWMLWVLNSDICFKETVRFYCRSIRTKSVIAIEHMAVAVPLFPTSPSRKFYFTLWKKNSDTVDGNQKIRQSPPVDTYCTLSTIIYKASIPPSKKKVVVFSQPSTVRKQPENPTLNDQQQWRTQLKEGQKISFKSRSVHSQWLHHFSLKSKGSIKEFM